MDRAFIISTGTELMLGSTVDTNAVFLSQRLSNLGFKVISKCVVGDSEEYIKQAFEQGLRLADLVVSSGGLGPTQDDLTKETACRVMGVEAVLFDEEVKRLRDYFQRRRREMPQANLKQAMFPREARILANGAGTAPGMFLMKNGKAIALLPGPPREMELMYSEQLEPLLKNQFAVGNRVARRTIKVLGPGESQVEQLLGELMNESGFALALLAKEGEVQVKVSAEANSLVESQKVVEQAVVKVEDRLKGHIFGYDDDTLEGSLACLLNQQEVRIAVAESCTGGLVAKILTDLPGSSGYFWGGICTYSNEAKKALLGVSKDTLENNGAVSAETAEEMAQGLLLRSGVDIALSITGIAGPEGGSEEKPVGLVYLSLASRGQVSTRELRFVGSRGAIRTLAAKSALDYVRRYLLGGGKG